MVDYRGRKKEKLSEALARISLEPQDANQARARLVAQQTIKKHALLVLLHTRPRRPGEMNECVRAHTTYHAQTKRQLIFIQSTSAYPTRIGLVQCVKPSNVGFVSQRTSLPGGQTNETNTDQNVHVDVLATSHSRLICSPSAVGMCSPIKATYNPWPRSRNRPTTTSNAGHSHNVQQPPTLTTTTTPRTAVDVNERTSTAMAPKKWLCRYS